MYVFIIHTYLKCSLHWQIGFSRCLKSQDDLRAAAPAADPGNETEELSFQPQGQQDGQDDRMLNLAPWDLSSPKKKSDLYAGKAAAKEILHYVL